MSTAGAALATPGAFRPGGLSWVVAERALAFLKAVGSLGAAGLQWVAASMPALHSAMLASLDHSQPLRLVLELQSTTVLPCVVLAHAASCCAMLCCAVLCCAVPCYAMPCHAMPCHAMPCHAMLCHAMLCCAVLCDHLRHQVQAVQTCPMLWAAAT